jgi:threonine aldolase
LGAPAGSLIATDDPAIMERLRRFRRMYGGAMRQAGILAAAGLYALEHNIQRLAEDHANAHRLATLLQQIPGIALNLETVATNIVFFDLQHSRLSIAEFVAALKKESVLLNAVGGTTCRAVTHLDISADAVKHVAAIVARVLR